MESLLHTRASSLPGHIQGVYVQNIAKLYSRIITKAEQEVSVCYSARSLLSRCVVRFDAFDTLTNNEFFVGLACTM